MSEQSPLEDARDEAQQSAKDPKTRRLLLILLIIWLFTIVFFAVITWNAYFSEKSRTQTLAQQIAQACKNQDFGPDMSDETRKALCRNAKEAIDDGELQEDEIQEDEIQDPEFQEPELQNPEIQNPENQNEENQDAEEQDAESQEDEVQDPEIQDPEEQEPEEQEDEIQDPEIDDPEPNDPDPNDQINAGSCTFDGVGTITMTFDTSSGPVTFSCTGTGTPPGAQ